jgi:hypothetical protein
LNHETTPDNGASAADFRAQGTGHLQETYLPAIGDGWSSQDLSATGTHSAGQV